MLRQCALLPMAIVFAAGCQLSAVTGSTCQSSSDCDGGVSCVNGLCAEPMVCNSDQQCPAGLVCSTSGLCEAEAPLPETCLVTIDCPLQAYCNTALEQPTCVPLLPGACREASQCNGQVCSALPGGVGRCVQCLRNSDCLSNQCLSSGTCAQGGTDAGVVARDASSGRDAGSGGNDPSCGADSQRCCGSGSSQATPCDSSNLRCLNDFPNPGDAYCWRTCTPVPCTSLEGNSGWCHIASNYDGSCQAVQGQACQEHYECQQLDPNAVCLQMSASVWQCYIMGCNWQADCASNYYCSTADNNLCLDVDLLMGG